jgi:hypothetical protein
MAAEQLAGEVNDPHGARVVVPAGLWHEKVLRDHPELGVHPAFANRKDPRSWSK